MHGTSFNNFDKFLMKTIYGYPCMLIRVNKIIPNQTWSNLIFFDIIEMHAGENVHGLSIYLYFLFFLFIY